MLFLSVLAACFTVSAASHDLVIEGPVMAADDGLLLGNGDLSCSVYQTADHLVFRLGKGDVWDRRMDFTDVPKPAHIQEFIDGELKEGWKSNPFDGNATEATKGTKNEKRMRELCGGKSAQRSPLPMPKPTGELRIKMPMDMPGVPKIVQRVVIEEARYEIAYVWKNGVKVTVKAVIPYDENVLAVSWKVSGWDDQTYVGYDEGQPAVWIGLTRWAERPYPDWCYDYVTDFNIYANVGGAKNNANLKVNVPPTSFVENGAGCIEQQFYPDSLFKDGFKYRLSLLADPETVGVPKALDVALGTKDAWVGLAPKKKGVSGEIAVAVTTSRDASFAAPARKPFAEYRAAAEASARADWATRALSVPFDPEIEKLWYATCHARRCVLRGGTVPPGLFLPSTIDDYSYWHGDYHANYNLQSIYWGCMNAGQMKQMEAYFDTVDFYVPIGRKIAKDYYNCRGVFITLEGFPTVGPDDHHGSLPLGRMAYMTGWFMEPYWEYYRVTMDKEWLAKRGYPFIRDCALFYLDFLKKAPNPNLPPELNDGKYHVFPSIEGESGFSGNPMDVCDKRQGVMHARTCLHLAIRAAEELGTDADLVAEWKERLENLVNTPQKFDGPDAEFRYYCWINALPEIGGREFVPMAAWDGTPPGKIHGWDNWYVGIGTMYRCGPLRMSQWVFERDYPLWRARLDKWTRPNGLVRAMCLAHYGRAGWTETLSSMAVLEEMLVQSWDGSLRLFPCWPKGKDVSFAGFRTQGAFVVSGEQKDGVQTVRVKSLKGVPCVLTGTWTVADEKGAEVELGRDRFGRQQFATQSGATYVLTRK